MFSAPARRLAWMALCCLPAEHVKAQQLSSSISLSQTIASNAPFPKIGNVNIVENGDTDGDPIPLCYLPYLHPFTNDDGPFNTFGQYEGLAAILLAMEHLNTGNGEIIPQFDGINRRCPLRFSTKAFDSGDQRATSVNHVISLTDRSAQRVVPCAILGAVRSVVSIPTAIISSLRGFPQISPLSTSAELDNKSQYRLFARTIPNDDGTSVPLVAKLASWNVEHLAVLHLDGAYGNSYANSIRLAAQNFHPNMTVKTLDIPVRADDGKISDAIQLLKETQYTYFFAVIAPGEFSDRVMTEAFNQGIAGTGKHTWLFSDSVGSTVTGRDFPIGSPLEQAYRGTGRVQAAGGLPGIDAYDKLASSMRQLGENERDRSFLEDSFPKPKDYPDGKGVNHSIITSQETFLKTPGLVAPFLYDAVALIGLASCRLLETSNKLEYFTGEELFQELLNTTLDGTTGSVILDPVTGTRIPQSAIFSLSNFVDDEDAGQGKVTFKGVNTGLFKSGKWESVIPYTFNAGSSDIPPDLPTLETNPNYLSTGLRAVGSILCGTIIVMALGFSYWTFHNSTRGVVRASQPIFLYLISAGTLLMGLSIIPLTMDKGAVDQTGADAACMAFCWLVPIGFSLTFSALFTKTHRIIQIMESAARFSRVKVTAVDVIKPMITLLMLNIVILSIWTAIDPLELRTVVDSKDQFGRDEETYGICDSDHASIFVSVLSVINLGSLLFALFQSYKARNISTDYQESSYIFLAMAFILIVSFIAVPIMIISRTNVRALYFVTVGLIFVVCASVLLLIFMPKVWHLREKNRNARVSDPGGNRDSSSEGIRIMSTPLACIELERENEKLRNENREGRGIQMQLESEVRELRLLLSKEKEET